MPLRVAIVDDEGPARSRLRTLLAHDCEVEIVGEAANGNEAVSMVRRTSPQVLLLDVEMPRLDGFGVLSQLGDDVPPVVIFTTAHAEHGAPAFDVNATDYLVKPFDRERLGRALARARRRLEGHAAPEIRGRWRERFAARLRGQIVFVKASEIVWIEAEINYARLHTVTSSLLIRDSMKNLEETLDPERFLRVHRSAIVNVSRIERIEMAPDGAAWLLLDSGARVPLGPSYRDRVRDLVRSS